MKVTLTYPSIGAAAAAQAFVICDDTMRLISGPVTPIGWATGAGGMQKEGFCNTQTRDVQKTGMLRAAYRFLAPRFNLANKLTLTVQRSFETDQQAAAFVVMHADLVPSSGELAVTLILSGARQTVYNMCAPAEIVIVKHQTLAVDTRYTFELAGPWSTTT